MSTGLSSQTRVRAASRIAVEPRRGICDLMSKHAVNRKAAPQQRLNTV